MKRSRLALIVAFIGIVMMIFGSTKLVALALEADEPTTTTTTTVTTVPPTTTTNIDYVIGVPNTGAVPVTYVAPPVTAPVTTVPPTPAPTPEPTPVQWSPPDYPDTYIFQPECSGDVRWAFTADDPRQVVSASECDLLNYGFTPEEILTQDPEKESND